MAFHFSSSSPSSLQSHNFLFLLHPSIASPLSLLNGSLKSAAWTSPKRKSFGLTCRSSINDDEDYLLDAPVSIGDGFSFSGGKYSDGPNPADEWVSRGKIVKAHPVFGAGKKAKDPIFGLAMGGGSQTSDDNFSGSVDNPPIVLIHVDHPSSQCQARDGFNYPVDIVDGKSVYASESGLELMGKIAYRHYRKEMDAQNPLLGDTTCGSLLQQVQRIWDEVGECDEERDKMLLQLELECLDVYKRKVDQAAKSKARLLKGLADANVELSSLLSALGEKSFVGIPEKSTGTINEQLTAIALVLEQLSLKKLDEFQSRLQGGPVAYSYRKVLPVLSKDYHAIGFDWLGFGFSDKPQPGYGFDYTLAEYVSSLESFLNELGTNKVSLVAQGYFSPVVVKYASSHQDKLNNLILLNPPDPLRASDKALTSCGPYKMKEADAMVYRRPYLTSGSSGFALNAISRAMKKELETYVEEMRMILMDKNWGVPTTICWGQRDRWLTYDGVEDFCEISKHRLIELPMAGHHVQEDCGEELGQIIAGIISKRTRF
ncbi:unnamed protein product [Camellia sinensis]